MRSNRQSVNIYINEPALRAWLHSGTATNQTRPPLHRSPGDTGRPSETKNEKRL
ncbi:MAG: hypothetical protein HY901_30355 [Deltaproteobacteria bacterium]|nr:hypothetical protein [Deltaproteobacteria bacterium]